jgi:uncharacterized protein HemX
LSFIDYVTTELNNCEKTFHSNEHNEQRTTDNEQRTTNNEQRTTNNEQQANEQRTTNNEQRTTNNEQQTTRKTKDISMELHMLSLTGRNRSRLWPLSQAQAIFGYFDGAKSLIKQLITNKDIATKIMLLEILIIAAIKSYLVNKIQYRI